MRAPAPRYASPSTFDAEEADPEALAARLVQLSRDAKSFYLTTSEENPFEQHFYRMSVNGGAREKITSKVGGHTATLSPDESMIADVYSYANRPPEIYVQQNKAGATASHPIAIYPQNKGDRAPIETARDN